MNISKKTIAVVLLSLAASLLISFHHTQTQLPTPTNRLLTAYTTTATRTTSVNTFCAGKTRDSLVDSSQQSANKFYTSQMASLFPIDGTSLIKNLLNGDYGAAQANMSANAAQVAGFIGPFIVGLVLILLISPFLCCCCACPDCCPAKCCRKNEDEQYTSCELYWPTVTLILALLLCIGACIAGFSQSQIISTSLDAMSCSSSIIFDDLLNGNVTSNGSSFFAGLKQISTQLGYLDTNLTTINNTMQNLQTSATNMTNTQNDATTALSDIAKIPANVNAGGNMAAIAYSTPLSSSSPSSTINSIFPDILGSSNTGGYVGQLYTAVTTVKTALSAISASADNFVTESSNYHSGVTALKTTVDNFTTFLTQKDTSLYSSFNSLSSNKALINLGVQLVYGITIGFASLMLIGALLVAFCDKTKCRYLVYFSCFILFFIGVVGFIISVFFSFAAPVVYLGCQFIDFSLSSATNFNANLDAIISDATQRNYLTACLPSSSGDIVSVFGGSSINAIQNLSSSLTSVGSFNVTYQASLLLSAMTQVTSYITNYQTGVILDITDSASITILKQLANATYYSSCAATGFSSDSWVPSDSQNPSYLACMIPGGNNAISSSCTGGNFNSRGGTCNGCMDTTSVLNTGTYASKSSVLTALGNRYSGCTTFNTDMSNVWDNYYRIKSNAYAPVLSRANTANTALGTFTSDLTGTIGTTFTNTINTLNAAASSVTDPNYGLMAGLNCKLIGEDIQRATTTFCKSVFNVTYFTRLVIGLASFGILFSLCCGVCTGVRFYKHSIRKLNSADNAGLSEQQVQDITNTNFVKPKRLE